MDIILKSLSSAAIVAMILFVAKVVGPKVSGIVAGIPIVFAISYVLITFENKAGAKDFLVGGIYGAFTAIFFALFLIILNYKLPDYHWPNFAVAYGACLFCAFGIAYFVPK